MFWGVTMENGKRYSQVVDMPVCITMASLEPGDSSKAVSVMIEHEKAEFLLCTLIHDKIPQQRLDLQFVEGEEVTLFLNGQGVVHLSGYSVDGDDHEMEESEGESEEDEEASSDEFDEEELKALLQEKDASLKRKPLTQSPQKAKKHKGSVDSDDDEEEDDDDDSDEDDEDLFVKMQAKGKKKGSQHQTPKKLPGQQEKTPKLVSMQTPKAGDQQKAKMVGQQTPKAGDQQKAKMAGQQTPKTSAVNGNTPGSAQEGSKKKRKKRKSKSPKQSPATPNPATPETKQQTPAATGSATDATPKKGGGTVQKLPGGIKIEDTVTGNGPMAKSGKMIQVYYKGMLSNGKEFDSNLDGKPFRFHLGKNEVIKGWDIGLNGMKVGGQRKIVVPPNFAYGNKSIGTIPPNSTLSFDVRLVSVK